MSVSEEIKGVFVSDMHFGYPGSRHRDGFNDDIIQQLAQYHLIVLGGDTADLHYIYHMNLWNALRKRVETGEIPGRGWEWGKVVQSLFHLCFDYHPTIENAEGRLKVEPALKACIHEAIDKTVGYLEYFCQRVHEINPDAVVLNLLGNHDNYKHFVDKLNELQQKQPNFRWHPEYYVIADGLFTHGDTVLRGQDMENREILKLKSYMQAWLSKEVESMLHNPIRENLFRYWNHLELVVPRFSEGLKEQPNLNVHLDRISRVFFGHVHSDPFFDYYYEGDRKLYTQTGSSVRKGSCEPAEMVIKTNGAPILFGGIEQNIVLPEAQIMSVRGVDIKGLSHRQPEDWLTRMLDRAAGKDDWVIMPNNAIYQR